MLNLIFTYKSISLLNKFHKNFPKNSKYFQRLVLEYSQENYIYFMLHLGK